ncbi:hypothetical protein IJH89_01955 [Candidatus Saccharibacteria bacterium]|nr:hypothetical protein [Candidatus Saccharibacteria bacterium]
MQDFYKTPDSFLPMSLRAFREEIQSRGWPKAVLNRGASSFLTVTRPDGRELNLYSLTPPTTNYFSGFLADDKLAAFRVLKSIGAPSPETELLELDPSARKAQVSRFLELSPNLVIKPVDGAHGHDVFMNLSSVEAVEAALPKDTIKKFLVQPQLSPTTPELRVICIDYKFVAAFARIPASVTGDGVHTVPELIKLENKTLRTAPYKSNLAYIDEALASDYIKAHSLEALVPKQGEKVRVISICNVGCGGTIENMTEKLPESKRRLSEKIARAFNLPVIGIDFLDDYVIEVNSSPSLHYPAPDSSSTLCVKKFVDYLETL